jgi:hypothetical protein
MFENNIKAYFTASAVVLLNETKQDLLKNLKKRDDDIKILLILIMFSSGEFKEIGTSVLFKSDVNRTFVYPEAICIIENCLSSYGYSDKVIEQVLEELTVIKSVWDSVRSGQSNSELLPIYNKPIQHKDNEKNKFWKGNTNIIIKEIVEWLEK